MIRIASKRYHVTRGAKNIPLNANKCINFKYIERSPALHMFDDATHISRAQFVGFLTTESSWETILTLRATVYTGLPKTLVFDDS